MEKTDAGTSVGVSDPYDHVDRCDYLTDEGKCRFAVEQGDRDPAFASDRRAEDYQCPVAGRTDEPGLTGPWDWADCEYFRCRTHDRECVRCGLEEVRMALDDDRPLLEEHHLSYASGLSTGSGDRSDGDGTDDTRPGHEITVYLCRWCHAKVHDSWAALDDDVGPDPEAIAAREERRTREQRELSFQSAADRYDRE